MQDIFKWFLIVYYNNIPCYNTRLRTSLISVILQEIMHKINMIIQIIP